MVPSPLCFSRPIDRRQAHSAVGTRLRWCRSHDHLIATIATAGAQVRVYSTKTSQVKTRGVLRYSVKKIYIQGFPLPKEKREMLKKNQ